VSNPGENDGSLDFGQLRVGESRRRGFALRNRGKYPVAFALRPRRASTAGLFRIEPAVGDIAPGAAVEVSLTFCSRAEVFCRGNRDIRCQISEPRTGETVERFDVAVTAAATWSRFRMQPARGVNFGAVPWDAGVQTKTFELKNEGEADFVFAL
ncbi:unnamed protein product, partial [Phaeothamnion confervicola]